MPKQTLLIYGDATRWQDVSEDEMNTIIAECFEYDRLTQDAGVFVAGEALDDLGNARVVAQHDVVTDGPFAELAEHLGGFYLLDTGSMDEAPRWAGRLPGVRRGLDRVEARQTVDFEE